MTFVLDQVQKISSALDRLSISAFPESKQLTLQDGAPAASNTDAEASRISKLQAAIKLLSMSSLSNLTLVDASLLRKVLSETLVNSTCDVCNAEHDAAESYEHDLEWLLVAKATAHTYGLVLRTLLDQIIPLNDDIWYWNEVLGSSRALALYSLQTSPMKMWQWGKDVIEEVQRRDDFATREWKQFYSLVRKVARERSIQDFRKRVTDPATRISHEVRQKQAALTRTKLVDASGIGYILSRSFDDNEFGKSLNGLSEYKGEDQWKDATIRILSTIHAVLDVSLTEGEDGLSRHNTLATSLDDEDLENVYNMSTSDLNLPSYQMRHGATVRLIEILDLYLPNSEVQFNSLLKRHGRPSKLVRYWIPATVLLVSSSTLLRIIANRKAEIVQWIREIGQTTIDFWFNWVLEPLKNMVGTIRHDEGSEISIMSKKSLEGDRASLERMVVDFAVDGPEGKGLGQADVENIRSGIREGDLTPVLKVYEKELTSPVYNSLRGNLIRALLIQIQKTKVDVEIAMGGIDSLLKSQQLVFGFVGLTPSILVCVVVGRWLAGLTSNRRDTQRGNKRSQTISVLRNVDRILTGSPQSNAGILSFREYGLLVCEATVLRNIARKTFPKHAYKSFLDDFDDLIDNKSGVGRQIRVAERIRWSYSRWL